MGQELYFKNADQMYQTLRQYEKVMIYGTGAIGSAAYRCFQESGSDLADRVFCFAVSRAGPLEASIFGKRIFGIEDLTQYRKTACVLVATRTAYHSEILQTLRELEFAHVFVLEIGILRASLEEILLRQGSVLNLPEFQDTLNGLGLSDVDFAVFATRILRRRTLKFEVSLVEHCNLNCQCCDHFSPLAQKEFLNPSVMERDFKRLSELFGEDVTQIDLLGGEPLLHPELPRLLELARQHFPHANLSVVTNGILLNQMPDAFWEGCRRHKIGIVVTKYPISVDYDALEKLSEERGVTFSVFYDSAVEKTSYHLPLNLRGDSNGYENFIKCFRSNSCIFLKNGRLYACTVAPNAVHFSKYFGMELPSTECDGIDIFQASSKEEIYAFLTRPLHFCSYCDAAREKNGIPWAVSKKRIEEWT